MPCSHKPIVTVLFWSLGKISKCWKLTELWTIRFWLSDRKTLDNRRKEMEWKRLTDRGRTEYVCVCECMWCDFSFPNFWVMGWGWGGLRYYWAEAWQLDKEASIWSFTGRSRSLTSPGTWVNCCRYMQTCNMDTHPHVYRHAQECVSVWKIVLRDGPTEQKRRQGRGGCQRPPIIPFQIGMSLSNCYPLSDRHSKRGREGMAEEESKKRRTSGLATACAAPLFPANAGNEEIG